LQIGLVLVNSGLWCFVKERSRRKSYGELASELAESLVEFHPDGIVSQQLLICFRMALIRYFLEDVPHRCVQLRRLVDHRDDLEGIVTDVSAFQPQFSTGRLLSSPRFLSIFRAAVCAPNLSRRFQDG